MSRVIIFILKLGAAGLDLASIVAGLSLEENHSIFIRFFLRQIIFPHERSRLDYWELKRLSLARERERALRVGRTPCACSASAAGKSKWDRYRARALCILSRKPVAAADGSGQPPMSNWAEWAAGLRQMRIGWSGRMVKFLLSSPSTPHPHRHQLKSKFGDS